MDRVLVRSGTWVILGTGVASALGFAYWVVAARSFSPAEVGSASAVVATLNLVASLSLFGANHLSVRFLPEARGRRALARGLQAGVALLGAACGLVVWACAAHWSVPVGTVGPVFAAACGFQAAFIVQDPILLGLGRASLVPVRNAGFGLAKLSLLVVAVAFAHSLGWMTLLWPWFASAAAGAGVSWFVVDMVSSEVGPSAHTGAVLSRGMVRFALASHFGGLFMQLPSLVFPVLVVATLGAEPGAYFYSSWMIASLLYLASSDMASALVARASAARTDLDSLFATALKYSLGIWVLAFVFLLALGRPVLNIFGPTYSRGYPVLVILVAASPACSLNAMCAALFRVKQRLAHLCVQGAFTGAIAVLLGLALASRLGLSAFGIAFAVAHALSAIVALAAVRRERALADSMSQE